jgi:hypothetical protein
MNTIYSLSLQNGEKLDKSSGQKLKLEYNNVNIKKYKLKVVEDDYYSILIRWKILFIVTKKDVTISTYRRKVITNFEIIVLSYCRTVVLSYSPTFVLCTSFFVLRSSFLYLVLCN